MRITELLDINSIDLNPQVSNKEEAINHLVDLLDQSGKLNDKEIYKEFEELMRNSGCYFVNPEEKEKLKKKVF